jgi:hypothetical protein
VTTYTEKWGLHTERFETLTQPTRLFHVPSGREVSRFYHNPEKEDKASILSCEAWSPDGRLLAVAEEESAVVRVLEIASGKVRVELRGHRDGVRGLAFSPDGKTLASGGEDNVVVLWDVTGARTGAPPDKVSDQDFSTWWTELAVPDAQRAGDALARLIRTPRSDAFLKERLRPVAAPDEKLLARLLADLDDNAFEQREAASRELAQLGERADTALRQALKNKPAPEAKRRIEELLEKLDNRSLAPEDLQALRAIEALEHIGTPEARKLLETLATGTPEARLTREAKAALKRVEK